MGIKFDVGSNDGSITGDITYAFEPNPDLAKKIQERHKDNPNYHFFQVAVSDFNGNAIFNVCEQADRGCSSLLELSANASTMWGGRKDMFPAYKTNVTVIRLDSLDWTQIPEVEHFHCDAQGSDLAVLKGLGEFYTRIKGGVVEAAIKHEALYIGQNSAKDTVEWLESHGFEVTGQTGNGCGNEVNVTFRRK